jgi:predicted Zn-dependent peptidase
VTRRDLLRALAASTLIPTVAAAAADTDTPPVPVPKVNVIKIRNGAKLVVLTEPQAPVVVLEALFRVGRAEEGGRSGLHALLARAWLGGAVNRSEELLRADAARVGAIGTLSGDEWVELWGVCASDEDSIQQTALTLFTNLVAQAEFPAEAVERARAAQIREIGLRRDDLATNALDQLRARAWGNSPLGNPLLGTEQSLSQIRPADVLRHYQRWFRPDRAVFVVAGPMEVEDAKRIIEASLGAGGWDEERPSPKDTAVTIEEIPFGLRDHSMARHAPATVFGIGYLAPGTASEKGPADWAALQVLDAIVCGGKANRLFPLRETGAIGYDVRSFTQPGRQRSLWGAYVVGDAVLNTTRDAITGALDALASGKAPITEAELARAKALVKAQHLTDRQRLKERAFGVGWSELMGLGAGFDRDLSVRVDTVTLADVTKLASTIFGARPAVIYSLPPKAEEPSLPQE